MSLHFISKQLPQKIRNTEVHEAEITLLPVDYIFLKSWHATTPQKTQDTEVHKPEIKEQLYNFMITYLKKVDMHPLVIYRKN
jgi:hypothetical protein